MDEEKDGSGEKAATVVKVLGAILVLLFALAYFIPKPSTQQVMYGVKIVSEIPLERLALMEYLAMDNDTKTPAELTCKFELSAVSKPDPSGYRVRISEGDYGIYLRQKDADIKGRSQQEILTACHVFACLRDGIECPNFMLLKSLIDGSDSMSVILDEGVGAAGGRGYAEIIGTLSYIQSSKVDTNGNEILEQDEVDANEFFIYPFVRTSEGCLTQPFNNLVQNWSVKKETVNCDRISPAIVIEVSNKSAITVDEGGRIVLSGSDDQIHTAAIILRDVLAPEWIRRIYGYR